MGQEVPKVEVFGGYSYGNFQILRSRSSLNGWGASATVIIYRWFGLTTDFGGLYGGTASETVPNSPAIVGTTTVHEKDRVHTILFGPPVLLSRRENLFIRSHSPSRCADHQHV